MSTTALRDRATPLLHDYLSATARRLGDKVALVCDGQRSTFAEIDRRADEMAAFFERCGVERGDRILIFAENTIDTVISFWAVQRANAVVSIVSPLTKADKLAYLLNDCRAVALVTQAHLGRVFQQAVKASPHLRLVVVDGEIDAAALASLPQGTRYADAVVAGARAPVHRCIESDLCAIIYTSGSTGDPKGVMHTHRSMITVATSVSSYLEMTEDDVVLCALPLSFGYGLYQVITSARVGARVVLVRSFAYPAEVLARMVEERVTTFPGVPTMFATLSDMKSASATDWPDMRCVTNAAAALHVEQIRAVRRMFPHARFYSMYGMTECQRCTYLPPEDLDRKPTSVGIAIPNTEMWIIDDAGQRQPAGKVGQLVIRGPTVMRGYWEKPEATAERLRPGPWPGEMILHTGDLCRMDDEGYLYFVGRTDDIIKCRGEKVAPKEVEGALCSIPGVREAAVIGVPDEVLGEAIRAFVVLEQGASLTPTQIQRECQSRLESFMVPKQVELVSALPRNASGKISKLELRSARASASPQEPT
jgi:amino acid adenylation domain-containing protein